MSFFDGIYNGLSFIIDPIFNPILNLPPAIAILIISIVIALITTFAYKLMTNQAEMKRLKEEQKAMQKEMKKLKDQPEKMMALNKQAMQKSMKLMNASFKPMLITMLPIILIFAWLNLHLAYLPIQPGEEFTTTVYFKSGTLGDIELRDIPDGLTLLSNASQPIVDDQASWTLQGVEGEYYLNYFYDSRNYPTPAPAKPPLVISSGKEYGIAQLPIKDSNIKQITVDYEKLKVNLLGFKLSWFWTYLIFTITLSTLLRKALKVY